jgi:3-hydroxybutyryl-CoA dehydrogenase
MPKRRMAMKSEAILPRKNIQTVGVVGGGLMGSGYAQLCAQSGYTVKCCEVNDEILQRGLASIDGRLAGAVAAGQIPGDVKAQVLGRISGTTDLGALSGCDLVIEAITEDMGAKKAIFATLDRVCPKDVVLATNTSVLSILDLAVATGRPDKVLGIHMNPLMFPVAELVRTIATSDETVEVASIFSQSLGKGVVIAKDIPGFIANRLITPLILDAIRMVESGEATRDDIDTIFAKGMGWFMGPLAMADGIGLDTLLMGSEAVYDYTKDPRFVPPTLLRKMVTAGWLGMKTGKGFYEYGG